jgi:NTE family protein
VSRAVVLGGGGSVGTAWQTGLIAEWANAGIDLSAADLVVGTSAGAGVGVLVSLGQDLGPQIARYDSARRRFEAGGETAVLNFDAEQAAVVERLYRDGHQRGRTDRSVRQAIADASAAAATMPEEDFLRTFRYLRGVAWPRSYVCTTVDIDTAEFVALDHGHGAELDRGVAAAVAVPGVYPPIRINGHRYVDGGCLSTTFLDLAAGHDRVLFVAMTDVPAGELETLHASGASLHTVRPDEASVASFGGDMMRAANAFGALETGRAQGRNTASAVARFWNEGSGDPLENG